MATVSLQSVFDEARQAIETGAADKAIGIARHILSHYPRTIEGARLLGEACLNAGRPDEAASAFEQVLAADPENVAAYYGLGLAHQSAERPEAAIPAFERALEIQPNLAELRTQLTRLYAESPGAASQFRLSRAGLGRLYARGGMFGQAIDEFRAVLDADPDRDDVRVALAESLWRDGQEDEAMDYCREILAQRPELLKPTVLLGYMLFASGDPRGEELWRRAAEQDATVGMAHTLFDILPPIRIEEPVLPEFDEAEWRAQEARRAAEAAERARQEDREREAAIVAPISTPAAAVDEDDFFADSWLGSAGVDQNDRWEPEPAATPLPGAEQSSAPSPEDDDDALLAALLGFGDADETTPESSADDDIAGVQPFALDAWDDESRVESSQAEATPTLEEIGLPDTDDESFGGDIKPFSLDEWDEEELPGLTEAAAETDESPESGGVQPFSLEEDEEIAGVAPFSLDQDDADLGVEPFSLDQDAADLGVEPFRLDESDEDAGLAAFGLDQQRDESEAAAEAGLGDVQPFSLDDWGLDDDGDSSQSGASTSPAAGEAGDLGDVQPFSLDDLSLESLEAETSGDLSGPGEQADEPVIEERTDFQWAEPAWRKQALAQQPPVVSEGDSIFERLMHERGEAPAEHDESAAGEEAAFFSLDDDPLRPDWESAEAAAPEESAVDIDTLNEAIGLGGADLDQDVTLPETPAGEPDVPELEDLLRDGATVDEQPVEEETMPFSLADLGISEDEPFRFEEGATAEGMTADSGEIEPFSLADLGLDETPAGAETAGEAETEPADVPGFSLSDLGLTDEELELLESQPAPEAVGESADATSAFTLGDLGFSDEEIADLGLDESPAADEIAERGESDADALPFSLADLGLSDDEIAALNEQPEWLESPEAPAAESPSAAIEPDAGVPEFFTAAPDDSQDRMGWDESPAGEAAAGGPEAESPLDLPEGAQAPAAMAEAESPAPPSWGEDAGAAPMSGVEAIRAQLDSEPDNDPLRLAVARMSHAMADSPQSLEHYRLLIRRGNLLDDVALDLQDMIAESDDPSMQRRLHRLLGDAYMKQGRVREAMDAYSWTPARAQ
jgi:tetratricopeptide (TPR) repeat protein